VRGKGGTPRKWEGEHSVGSPALQKARTGEIADLDVFGSLAALAVGEPSSFISTAPALESPPSSLPFPRRNSSEDEDVAGEVDVWVDTDVDGSEEDSDGVAALFPVLVDT
jgi:hypothetical protein